MFLLWRVAKSLIKLALLCVLLLAGFFAWALLWPAPGSVARERCSRSVHGCVVASGRVLFHTSFGPHRQAHVVLISSRSTTLPGIVAAEFPAQMTRAPAGLAFGDWISIEGWRGLGSHHEREIHVRALATSATRIRCATSNGRYLCRRAR